MSKTLVLLPTPRSLTFSREQHFLRDGRLILLSSPSPRTLQPSVKRLQQCLHRQHVLYWNVVASTATPPSLIGATLRVDPQAGIPSQGYKLSIAPDEILIEASEVAGVFYGVCTLIQIIEQCTRGLPCLQISDWPDFPARGVMLDISRDKVPTLHTVRSLVEMLAGWKINQFQLYTEHTFAYLQHPEVWAEASPFTGQEIMELDEFCRERCIELVPNQNSFGHMHRWLIHPRYAPLGEVSAGFDTPWGHMKGPFSLCPLDPGSLALMSSLYDELLPHFSSRMVNVGCDETFDLGQGGSKEEVARRGAGRVYLDFLLEIYRNIKARGYTMQFWGDIIIQHPELIPELPRDLIALEWGYEATHPFAEHSEKFASAGNPFYVCPGTSSWNSIAGRTDNAIGNLLNAAENGLKYGAVGYLNTDWGDNGHWQTFPISFLGFAAGAAYSWALEANRSLNIAAALTKHAFHDQGGVMGQIAYDLGNVYRAVGFEPSNSSALFWALQMPFEDLRQYHATGDWQRVLEATDMAMRNLSEARMERPDSGLVKWELELAARMLRFAARRGMLATNDDPTLREELGRDLQRIMDDHRRNWLARNRPGGLPDSLARFENARSALS